MTINNIKFAIVFIIMIMKSDELAINFAVRINNHSDVIFMIAVHIVIFNCCSIAQTEIIDVEKIKLDSDVEERAQFTIKEFAHKYFCEMLNSLMLIRKYRIINDSVSIESKVQIIAICDEFFHEKCTKTKLNLKMFDILRSSDQSSSF